MAFTKKTWFNKGQTGATASNSVASGDNMNDLEARINDAFFNVGGIIQSPDFNALGSRGTGIFIGFGPCTNAPTGNSSSTVHWYIIQIKYSSSYILQMAVNLHSAATLYQRIMTNGAWGSWYKIGLTAMSDGTEVANET